MRIISIMVIPAMITTSAILATATTVTVSACLKSLSATHIPTGMVRPYRNSLHTLPTKLIVTYSASEMVTDPSTFDASATGRARLGPAL